MCIAAVLLAACGSHVEERSEPFVTFDLQPAAPNADGSRQWLGTYSAGGKTAKFQFDFGPPESTSGEGTILPQPGSDSSVLLAALQKALGAQSSPNVPPTKTSVPFTYSILGDRDHMKLTFGDGDRQSEILLDIDATLKKGRFSSKDPRYADLVLAELAKVL